MKRLLVVLLAALAFPAAAHAKEVTGLELCGASGCESTDVSGFGHADPLNPTGSGQTAPPPTSFYRLNVLMDGDGNTWPIYYEPKSGLVAFTQSTSNFLNWARLRPQLATLVKELARQVEPFPTPTFTEVRIGDRVLTEGAASYLRLHAVKGQVALPGDGDVDVIRFDGGVESPWTDGILLYYPEDDVLVRTGGQYIRLPADLAADIEAGRPLVDGEAARRVVPWVVIGIVGAFAVVLLASMLWRRRSVAAPTPAVSPR